MCRSKRVILFLAMGISFGSALILSGCESMDNHSGADEMSQPATAPSTPSNSSIGNGAFGEPPP